ncbi:MAG TPA: hypothetical protein VFD40_00510 [Candidatus Paceibacterota bacterium]|nr:hypothetical protein [Candidatus Paceibacterota bacterium]
MTKNPNFLNSYKLAYQDRTIFFKNSIFGILIVACFALGSLFFIGLLQDFTNANLIGTSIFWIIGLCLLPIFFLLLPLKDFLIWNLVISFSTFIPLLLSHQWNKILWLIWAIVFMLFLLSRIRIKMEHDALINLQWIRIISKSSFYILLALVISLSTLTYFQANAVSIEQVGIKILDYTFSRTGIIKPFSGLQLSGTVDNILGKYIEQQAPDLGGFGSIVNKPILQETKSKLSEFIKYPVVGNEKLSTLIVETLKFHWQTISSYLRTMSGIIIFLVILSFLKFFNIIFSVILIAISWVFLQILLSLKYLKIKRVGIEKQEIIIS